MSTVRQKQRSFFCCPSWWIWQGLPLGCQFHKTRCLLCVSLWVCLQISPHFCKWRWSNFICFVFQWQQSDWYLLNGMADIWYSEYYQCLVLQHKQARNMNIIFFFYENSTEWNKSLLEITKVFLSHCSPLSSSLEFQVLLSYRRATGEKYKKKSSRTI